ncbi:hypothetical protein PVK06_036298 [Gossypium arboreum]|uniref:Uncharacterized protein n=1 Tax=Gossypium arboreum TaxID=29729 RepID=A0ABR0NJQ1_GOSAR|nr:hypothetical protein PVK06_036298 [Gossypium arboreum]
MNSKVRENDGRYDSGGVEYGDGYKPGGVENVDGYEPEGAKYGGGYELEGAEYGGGYELEGAEYGGGYELERAEYCSGYEPEGVEYDVPALAPTSAPTLVHDADVVNAAQFVSYAGGLPSTAHQIKMVSPSHSTAVGTVAMLQIQTTIHLRYPTKPVVPHRNILFMLISPISSMPPPPSHAM